MYRITCSAFSRATCHIANETAPLAYRAKLTNKLYSVQLKNVLHCILLIVIQFKSPNETFSLEHFRPWIVRDDDWWLNINFFFHSALLSGSPDRTCLDGTRLCISSFKAIWRLGSGFLEEADIEALWIIDDKGKDMRNHTTISSELQEYRNDSIQQLYSRVLPINLQNSIGCLIPITTHKWNNPGDLS